MPIVQYLYRGTTVGWPGNSVLQEEQLTCTSTDPVVATLFAIECRNHGRAVILVAANRGHFLEIAGPRNHFLDIESAVNLRITPLQFAQKAEVVLDVDKALAILQEIGFDDLPVRLKSKETLNDALWYSYKAGQRLNEETTPVVQFAHDRIGTMTNKELMFIVDGFVHVPGERFNVVGRCGDVPIPIGEVFDVVYRNKKRRYPDELGDDSVREVEKPAAIRVVCVHAYERSLKALGEGMTGSLTLEGDGLQFIAPGWILGRKSDSDIATADSPMPHSASLSS